MDILISTLWAVMLLFLLYETSVVYTYAKSLTKLLPFLNYFTHIKEYEKQLQNSGIAIPPSYSQYMTWNHNGFMIELFNCRYCLGFWLSLILVNYHSIVNLPIVYLGSQLGYSLFRMVDKYLVQLGEPSDE